MISYIHIYKCLYEMCFAKWFHVVCVSRSDSLLGLARGRDSDNVITNHLSILEKPTEEERGTETEKSFPNEQLFQVLVQVPLYAGIVNYLAYRIIPPEFNYQ